MFGGGKGANQAVAAARAGGAVTFLGAYGADTFGTDARGRLVKEGINVDYFQCVQSAPSGIALILVDGVTRDNLIAVAKSANEAVDSAMVSAARPVFETADAVISQLEIRDGAIEAIARTTQGTRRQQSVWESSLSSEHASNRPLAAIDDDCAGERILGQHLLRHRSQTMGPFAKSTGRVASRTRASAGRLIMIERPAREPPATPQSVAPHRSGPTQHARQPRRASPRSPWPPRLGWAPPSRRSPQRRSERSKGHRCRSAWPAQASHPGAPRAASRTPAANKPASAERLPIRSPQAPASQQLSAPSHPTTTDDVDLAPSGPRHDDIPSSRHH